MYAPIHKLLRLPCALMVAGLCGLPAHAWELYKADETVVNADLEAMGGILRSSKSYATIGNDKKRSVNWQEGYVKYGFSGSLGTGGSSALYGKLNALTSGTWGDGDAANISSGGERRTSFEDVYGGWRSGNLFPALGADGIDISFGRQLVMVGDGFLIGGDMVSPGDSRSFGTRYDRGGGYYLAAHRSFGETAVLRIGGNEGLRGDLMWLKSNNHIQGDTEMGVGVLEYVAPQGTLGLTWIHGIDVDKKYTFIESRLARDGMDTVSLRGAGNLGVENLNLSFEYAHQELSAYQGAAGRQKSTTENGWYVEGSWTFADVPWKPTATYRYSRFSELYDPLFYGFSRGFGVWFQGEVAANYAGPLSSNDSVHHVGLKLAPREDLELGALFFRFHTLDNDLGNLSGNELDLYAMWTASEHWQLGLLGGLYKPKKSADNGGTQLGGDGTNHYLQFTVMVTY
ncbi:MAG: alginate export family protein [Azonexus sp.]|nr:alginate export family protein [Azonexus sp.]